MMQITTRKEGKEKGLVYYFTGKPCKYGHVDKRFISSSNCVQCALNLRNVYKVTRKEDLKLYHKKWREDNKEHTKTVASLYHQNHKELINSRKKEYYKQNRKLWLAKKHKRRLAEKNAVPKWANLEKIKEIYINCPKHYHVDHILPIQGKLICGLHVENNLQYLTEEENKRKASKFEPYIELCHQN